MGYQNTSIMKTHWTPSSQADHILRTYAGIHSLRPRNPRHFERFFVLRCAVKNDYLLCTGFTYYTIWMAEVHWWINAKKKKTRSADTRMYILCIAFACQNIRLNFNKFWNHPVRQTLTEICRNNNMGEKAKKNSVNSTETQTGFSELPSFIF